MNLFWQLTKIFLTILLLSQLAAKNALAVPNKNLTIFAEPNLMMAMTKLARIYSRQYNVTVSVTFDSSEDLVEQIDQGDPADLFISAHRHSISDMKQKGLADYYNIGFFAKDQIVLVKSKKNKDDLLDRDKPNLRNYLKQLSDVGATIITDSKGSSSGGNVISYLDNLNLKNIKIFSKVSEDSSSVTKLITNDKDRYGLLFLSQVYDNDDLIILAQSEKNDIFYQALVVLGYNMEIAREFLRFLDSKTAQDILKENKLISG